MRAVNLVLLSLLAGCSAPTTFFEGEDIYKLFPLEGFVRTWTYELDSTDLPYRLVARQQEESEILGSVRVHTLSFSPDCFNNQGICADDEDDDGVPDAEGVELYSWKVSSDSLEGVLLHEVQGTVFDPPVMLADAKMKQGEPETSTSNGITFTTTWVSEEECPAPRFWPDPDTRPECKRVELEDAGAGTAVAGVYWLVARFGLVGFSRDADGAAVWGLREYSAEEL